MPREASPSDLTDAEWAVVAQLLPPPYGTGRPEAHDRRDLLDAIFHQLRQGGAWRGLPHDFPPWQTLYWWFRPWIRDGTLARVVATPR